MWVQGWRSIPEYAPKYTEINWQALKQRILISYKLPRTKFAAAYYCVLCFLLSYL